MNEVGNERDVVGEPADMQREPASADARVVDGESADATARANDATHWRELWTRLRTYATVDTPIESTGLDAFLFGVTRPVFGMALLLRDRDLLWAALLPSLVALAIGATLAVSTVSEERGIAWWVAFYGALAGMAPVPPVLFARQYAKMAARACNDYGFGPRQPYLRSLATSAWEALLQITVLAIGVAPWAALAGLVPGIGAVLAFVITSVWVLHWIVVEAFDSARTLPAEAPMPEHDPAGHPWYSLLYDPPGPAWIRTPARVVRPYARLLERMTVRWHGEVAILERHPWVAAGFSIGTAILLAVPVLNLLFRPAIVIAAAQLRVAFDRSDGIDCSAATATGSATSEGRVSEGRPTQHAGEATHPQSLVR